jgi:hypothetical protein
MPWPWNSSERATRLAEDRKARFVQIARDAHERARRELGDQKLKRRDWDQSGPMDRAGARFEREQNPKL